MIRIKRSSFRILLELPLVCFWVIIITASSSRHWRQIYKDLWPYLSYNIFIYCAVLILVYIIIRPVFFKFDVNLSAEIAYLNEEKKRKLLGEQQRGFALLLRGFFSPFNFSSHYDYTNSNWKLYDAIGRPSISFLISKAVDNFAIPIALNTKLAFDNNNWERNMITTNFTDQRDLYYETKLNYIYTFNESWQKAFSILAEKSHFMILVPALTQGVKAEIDLIKSSGLMEKVLVLMPPTLENEEGSIGRIETEWNKSREEFTSWGYNLPPYVRYGYLYIPMEDLSCRVAANVTLIFKNDREIKLFNLKKAMHFLTQFIPPNKSTMKETMLSIKDLIANPG